MNVKKIFTIFCLVVFLSYNSGVKATEECFEGFSRSVFKFNLVFDDIILEPIAKGYSKLPKPIKQELVILLRIFPLFQFQIPSSKI